jgi:hypothetical protein
MGRSGSGSMFSFGSSKAMKYEPTTERVTFADVTLTLRTAGRVVPQSTSRRSAFVPV